MKKVITIALLAAAVLSAAPPIPWRSNLSADLTNLNPLATVRVIIQWKNPPTQVLDQKVTSVSGSLIQHFNAIKGGVYEMPAASLATLASDPNVAFISPDRTIQAKLDTTAAAVNASVLWKAGLTGAGIGVAVIDSGIDTDLNLGSGNPPVFSYDFTKPAALAMASTVLAGITQPFPASASSPLLSQNAPDQFGHGQHVAGIIASNGKASQCAQCNRLFKGIAPNVNLVDLKVLDQNGQGTDSQVINAIEAAIALKNIYNIRVINLSLGRPVYESYTQDPLCQAVEAAWKAGIVVVVAAGNDGRDDTYGEQGYGTINAPGNDPYVITVGAIKTEGTYTRADDLVASYSSKGPTQVDYVIKPDVVAPGNLIVSLLASGSSLASEYPGNVVPASYYMSQAALPSILSALLPSITNSLSPYFTLSGTSMAAPVVSAAAADLLQSNPKLTPDQIKALLMQTASKSFPVSSSVTDPSTGQTYTDDYDMFTVGAGYIDLAAALSNIGNVPASGTALSPVASYDPSSGNVTAVFDPSSIWSIDATSAQWSPRAVWSSVELGANDQVLWGSQAVWGQPSDPNSTTIWGARSLWGAASMYSSQSASSSSTDTSSRSLWGANISVQGEN